MVQKSFLSRVSYGWEQEGNGGELVPRTDDGLVPRQYGQGELVPRHLVEGLMARISVLWVQKGEVVLVLGGCRSTRGDGAVNS